MGNKESPIIRKAGQMFCWNGMMFRLKHKTDNCKGCWFEKKLFCPNIPDKNGVRAFNCLLNPLIFTK